MVNEYASEILSFPKLVTANVYRDGATCLRPVVAVGRSSLTGSVLGYAWFYRERAWDDVTLKPNHVVDLNPKRLPDSDVEPCPGYKVLFDQYADQLVGAKIEVEPYMGSVPLQGPGSPPLDTINDALRYLATVGKRFGNTPCSLKLSWGSYQIEPRTKLHEENELLKLRLRGAKDQLALLSTCAKCETLLAPDGTAPHCMDCSPSEEEAFDWFSCMKTAEDMMNATEVPKP